MPGKLFCFDFDDTITNAHMHAYMFEKWKQDPSRPAHPSSKKDYDVQKFLRETGGVKNKAALEATMKHILSTGNKIAITSFSWFPDQIKEVLGTLDLRPFSASQIVVVPGYPCESGEPALIGGDPNHQARKEQHIQKAMRLTGMEGTHPRNVILIDDSAKNIKHAKACDHQALHVPATANPPPHYLKLARDIASAGPTEVFRPAAQQRSQSATQTGAPRLQRTQASAPATQRTRPDLRRTQNSRRLPTKPDSSAPPVAQDPTVSASPPPVPAIKPAVSAPHGSISEVHNTYRRGNPSEIHSSVSAVHEERIKQLEKRPMPPTPPLTHSFSSQPNQENMANQAQQQQQQHKTDGPSAASQQTQQKRQTDDPPPVPPRTRKL